MADTKRQARYREKMKAEGRVQLSVWVTPPQAAAIRAYLDGNASLVTKDKADTATAPECPPVKADDAAPQSTSKPSLVTKASADTAQPARPKPVPVDTEPATVPKPQGKPKMQRVVDPGDIARLPIPEAYRGGVEASFWVLVEGHKIGLVWKKRVTKTLVWWYSAPLRSRGRLKVPKKHRTRQKALEALIG